MLVSFMESTGTCATKKK